MQHSGSCIIEIAGGRHPPEAVSFSFSDDQVELLRGYLSEAERLEKSLLANGGFPVSLNLSATVGQPVKLSGVQPTDDQVAIFVHRLRPFQLQKEPYQFGKIKNIVAQGTVSSPFMQSYLDRTTDMFTGAAMQQQVQISIGDAILNSEAALIAWLYAVEYHRDETKMIALLKGKQPPPEQLARPIFMMLLRAKIDAVLALGNIVHRLSTSPEETRAPDA
jgi:hypothetical protein